MAQVVELSSNPNPTKKKKIVEEGNWFLWLSERVNKS
jgi:hypothetical protein